MTLGDTEQRTLTSAKIGQRYDLLVSSPSGYATSGQSYPVLYILAIIVLHGDQFEVLGSGKVTITEAGHQQYSISPGSNFNLRKRKPL